MTSVGARTRKLRMTALMRVEHEGVYAVVASMGGAPRHPVWYYNLIHDSARRAPDGAHRHDYLAREVVGEERATCVTAGRRHVGRPMTHPGEDDPPDPRLRARTPEGLKHPRTRSACDRDRGGSTTPRRPRSIRYGADHGTRSLPASATSTTKPSSTTRPMGWPNYTDLTGPQSPEKPLAAAAPRWCGIMPGPCRRSSGPCRHRGRTGSPPGRRRVARLPDGCRASLDHRPCRSDLAGPGDRWRSTPAVSIHRIGGCLRRAAKTCRPNSDDRAPSTFAAECGLGGHRPPSSGKPRLAVTGEAMVYAGRVDRSVAAGRVMEVEVSLYRPSRDSSWPRPQPRWRAPRRRSSPRYRCQRCRPSACHRGRASRPWAS